ncbi:MAG TPA: Slp family lipoprotein [Desulfuromonadales bacterium]|jgi:outer membrane lipoprotein
MRLFCLVFAALLGAAACTTSVSKQSLNLVDPGLSFEALRQAPDRHVGRYLLLGGAIASVRVNGSGGSELEVVQFPTDRRGRITSTDRSDGRFIALDNTFRDPAVYRSGRLITLVGQVVGKKTGRLGEADYLYPVLTVHELHLWDSGEYPGDSPVHFGLGLGVGVIH